MQQTSNFAANTWEHTLLDHPDKSLNFSPKEKETLILRVVAEQNSDMLVEMETLKDQLYSSQRCFFAPLREGLDIDNDKDVIHYFQEVFKLRETVDED